MKYDLEKFKKQSKEFKPTDEPMTYNELDHISFFKEADLHIRNHTTGATFNLTMENTSLKRIRYIHQTLYRGI